MDTIRISSVHGGSSYAPEFIAKSLGFFSDEDLEVTIHNHGLGPWAARSVIEGEAEVGMGGMWRPLMYRDRVADLKVFAQMCNRCHSNILARREHEAFSLRDLAGQVVMIPSGAPSQGLFLKGLLRRAGVDLSDVHFIHDFLGAEAIELFCGGLADYFLMTSPEAERLVAQGDAYIAASLAEIGGEVPWSIYYALPEFLDTRADVAARFVRAIQRGRDWASTHDPSEAPSVLTEYFPSVELPVAIDAFRAVRERGIWTGTVRLPEDPQRKWQEMLVEGRVIPNVVPYEDFYDDRAAAWAIAHADETAARATVG